MASSSDKTETRTLTAKCYCKAIHFTLTLPTSQLPLETHTCSCSTCRYTHGALCIFQAQLPKGVVPQFISPSSKANLTSYTSPGVIVNRYFCSTCSCQIGDVSIEGNPNPDDIPPEDQEWGISSAIFEAPEQDAFDLRTHKNTKSAPGGGLADWLPTLGDKPMEIWNPKDESVNVPLWPKAEVGADGKDRLRVECHCGGVSFTAKRPTEENLADEFVNKYVSPLDKTKWMASIDACDDCRLCSGVQIGAWTYVPLADCEPKIKSDLLIGTAKTYSSSKGVLRCFCGKCGATIFFACDDRRPSEKSEVVDIAMGVIRAPEGVKAEDWVTWRAGRLGWLNSGLRFHKELAESLDEGMKKWSLEKYGVAPEFEIGQ